MTSDQLKAFLVVADRLQLTAAARQLGVSQPTLSRKLQSLESELGVKLLVRTPRGAVLSEAGERFVPHARRSLDALRAGVTELDELAQKPRGTVALGVISTVGLSLVPELLQRFHRQFPQVAVRLSEQPSDVLEEQLARGDVDLAVLSLPVRRLDLVAQKLWHEEYVLFVPKGHRLTLARSPVALADVAGEPMLVFPHWDATHSLRAACEERGQVLRIVLETESSEILRRMIERGMGIAFLPAVMAQGRGPRAFELVRVGKGGRRRHVAVVHRGEESLNSAGRALKRLILDTFRRPLPWTLETRSHPTPAKA